MLRWGMPSAPEARRAHDISAYARVYGPGLLYTRCMLSMCVKLIIDIPGAVPMNLVYKQLGRHTDCCRHDHNIAICW